MSRPAIPLIAAGVCWLALACASSAPPPSRSTTPGALPGAFTAQQLAARWKLENDAQEQRLKEQARVRAEQDAQRKATAEREARDAEAQAARLEAEREALRAADEKRLRERLKEIEREGQAQPRNAKPVEYVRPSSSAAASEDRECCKICKKGCACGDSCISCDETCYLGVGCACDP